MFRTSSNFGQLLDTATSNLHLDPDWPTILQICDLIRQGDVSPKVALTAIKKKITNSNPHVALFGLLVLESCVKNCGHLIHDEIGTKQYMEQLTDLVKTTPHEDVKMKTLQLIQAWAFAFRNSTRYTAVKDTLNILKAQEYVFPELKESDAMFSADAAPEWADSEECNRCRTIFNLVQRKHHCRACGQVFCNQCSSKSSTLPKFGIEKIVRVCDACYIQLNKPSTAQTKENDLPVEYLSSSLAQQQQVPPRKTAEELQEEEELNLALALSQSEAEQKEKEKKRITNSYNSNISSLSRTTYSPPPSTSLSPSKAYEEEETNPELAKYLNRQYWEQRSTSIEEHNDASRGDVTSPSAPNISSPMPQRIVVGKQQSDEIDNRLDEFVTHLRSQVEIFVNRMKSNSSRGRSIINDSFFQGLFMNITAMHSRLLKYIQEHDDTRVSYEGLQDKLAQVKDARDALDVLREEHREKLRREAEEAERQKQMLMAMKLDIMRKKKQEYLNYQRQLALQKIQEQERELQMRQEQQKQQYMMGGYQNVAGFMGPSSQGSPIRHVHYHPPGANYNPMSPTNQGMHTYGPSPINTYTTMQNYGISHMTPVPPHMIPSNMPNSQEQSLVPQQTVPDSVMKQRDGISSVPQTGIIAQMANIPTMSHVPSPVHMGGARIVQPPNEIAQSLQPSITGGVQSRLRSNALPGYMNMSQPPPNNVQMPPSVQPMPQHVPAPNNVPAQPSVSMRIVSGGGIPQHAPETEVSVPAPQRIPAAASQSVQMESLHQIEEKKSHDTAELISFD